MDSPQWFMRAVENRMSRLNTDDRPTLPVQEHVKQDGHSRTGLPCEYLNHTRPFQWHHGPEARFDAGLGQVHDRLGHYHPFAYGHPQWLASRQPAEDKETRQRILPHFAKTQDAEGQHLNDHCYRRELLMIMTGISSSNPYSSALQTRLNSVDKTSAPLVAGSLLFTAVPTVSSVPTDTGSDLIGRKEKLERQKEIDDALFKAGIARLQLSHFGRKDIDDPASDTWSTTAQDGMSEDAMSEDGMSDIFDDPIHKHHVRPGKLDARYNRAWETKLGRQVQNFVARRDVKDEQRGDANHYMRVKLAQWEVKRHFGSGRPRTKHVKESLDGKVSDAVVGENAGERNEEGTMFTGNVVEYQRDQVEDVFEETYRLA